MQTERHGELEESIFKWLYIVFWNEKDIACLLPFELNGHCLAERVNNANGVEGSLDSTFLENKNAFQDLIGICSIF